MRSIIILVVATFYGRTHAGVHRPDVATHVVTTVRETGSVKNTTDEEVDAACLLGEIEFTTGCRISFDSVDNGLIEDTIKLSLLHTYAVAVNPKNGHLRGVEGSDVAGLNKHTLVYINVIVAEETSCVNLRILIRCLETFYYGLLAVDVVNRSCVNQNVSALCVSSQSSACCHHKNEKLFHDKNS